MRKPFVTLVAILALGVVILGASSRAGAQATPAAGGGASHPAHIHNGTCAELGDVVQPLSNVSAEAMNNSTPMAAAMVGSSAAIPVLSSVTTVQMALQDILNGDHAINVHESAENISNYVACGDIGGPMIGDTDLLFGMAPLNNSGLSGVASLHDNGDGTTTVYVYLTSGTTGGAATPAASPAASGGQSTEASISMVDIAFDPTELTIPADTDVTITATNNGKLPHTFTIKDKADTGQVQPGESATVTVNLPAGEYDFDCTEPGHADAGMKGKLIVQ
jgi:plastocyanin